MIKNQDKIRKELHWDLDPYNEENWNEDKKWHFPKLNFWFVQHTIIFVLFSFGVCLLFCGLFNVGNYNKGKTKNVSISKPIKNLKEICYYQLPGYKVCYSKYYKKYAIKDLKQSIIWRESYYIKSYGELGYLLCPLSVSEPTMFDDSSDAKKLLKKYHDYTIKEEVKKKIDKEFK